MGVSDNPQAIDVAGATSCHEPHRGTLLKVTRDHSRGVALPRHCLGNAFRSAPHFCTLPASVAAGKLARQMIEDAADD
jgi:hypothetical protein